MAATARLLSNILCADVECVFNGQRHDASMVAHVAMVDKDKKVILKRIVKPDKLMFSYLTPITGLKEGDLDGAPHLEEVIKEVKVLIDPNMVLVVGHI